jgi:predicted nucleotide-binding protein (sugar kinase/HSP70/actin superfamily)
MCCGSSRTLAAAFRSEGIDARVCPEAGDLSRERAARNTTGDECFPQRVTLADFFQAMEEPDFDRSRAALFMPTASGPCRFGQYAAFFRRTLDNLGHRDIAIFSPTCDNSYRDIGIEPAARLHRTSWWGIVGADLLRNMLYKVRPYEKIRGETDQVYEAGLEDLCAVIADRDTAGNRKLDRVVEALARARDRFTGVAADFSEQRPLIGVVGEIFCRFNIYSNQDICRGIEDCGGEVRLSDTREWIWYTSISVLKELKRLGRVFSKDMLDGLMVYWFQTKDEKRLCRPFHNLFAHEEEPPISRIIDLSRPYLPWEGALGEMLLSVGKAIHLQKTGADGIIDVSPFTCMNGIVTEAIFPAVSRDHDGIPIRNFYVDDTAGSLTGDLSIFMELARNYRRHKKIPAPASTLHDTFHGAAAHPA